MKKKAADKPRKRTILNKKANFAYTATDSIEVGMVLTGQEIKGIRAGRMQLTGSYGRFLRGEKEGKPELWLVGAQIANTSDKQRSIKLLAHRSEIDRLQGLVGQKGMTLVPSKVYFKHNRAKLALNVSRGTKEYEKREKIKARDQNRAISRVLRQR